MESDFFKICKGCILCWWLARMKDAWGVHVLEHHFQRRSGCMRKVLFGLALATVCATMVSCAEGDSDGQVWLASVSPSSGAVGDMLTLTGLQFAEGMSACFVLPATLSEQCESASVASASSATVQVPSLGVADGTSLDIRVVLPDGSSYLLEKAFTYHAATGEKCDDAAPKCSEDGRAVLTCVNGKEARTECGAAGCAGGQCRTDGSIVVAPSVSSMTPPSGHVGDKVVISGKNLSDVTQVCFGTTCVKPANVTDTTVEVDAPEATGRVSVYIVSGETRLKTGDFSYLPVREPGSTEDPAADKIVEWCQMMMPMAQNNKVYLKPGEMVEAYAQVYKTGVTGLSGTHEGITGYVFYSPVSANETDMSKFSRKAVVRNTMFNASSAPKNDEYMASNLSLEAGEYKLAFGFTMDDARMFYCDLDGSTNGFDMKQLPTVVVAAEIPKSIGWCNIRHGKAKETVNVSDEITVAAQFFVKDCTNYKDHCADLKAQIGYGSLALTSAESLEKDYTWKDAAINANYDGSGGKEHDEFIASLKSDKVGEYGVLYRGSVNGGKDWVYCDISDNNIFSMTDALQWSVVDPENPDPQQTVAWCAIQYPHSIESTVGGRAETVYGRVRVANCTGTDKGCPNLQAQLGVGEMSKSFEELTYTDATLNTVRNDDFGFNDEYMADLTIPEKVGTYHYAYRFRLGDEGKWTYCDTNIGDKVSSDIKDAGILTVKEVLKPEIGWCRIVNGNTAISAQPGKATEVGVYAQVYVNGCTHAAGPHCEGLLAQFGYGKKPENQEALESFTWLDAAIDSSFSAPMGSMDANNDQFVVFPTIEKTGTYSGFYRVGFGDDQWIYCDTQGYNKDDATAETPDLTKAFIIDVVEPEPDVPQEPEKTKYQRSTDFTCGIESSDAAVSGKVNEKTTLTGDIWMKSCTENTAEACKKIVAARVYYIDKTDESAILSKAPDVSESSKWQKADAAYSAKQGNNDRYQASVSFEKAGNYAFAYAFDLKQNPDDSAETVQTEFCYVGWGAAPAYAEAKITQ